MHTLLTAPLFGAEKCTSRSKPGIPNSPMQKRESLIPPENHAKNSIAFSVASGKQRGNRITSHIAIPILWHLGNITASASSWKSGTANGNGKKF